MIRPFFHKYVAFQPLRQESDNLEIEGDSGTSKAVKSPQADKDGSSLKRHRKVSDGQIILFRYFLPGNFP